MYVKIVKLFGSLNFSLYICYIKVKHLILIVMEKLKLTEKQKYVLLQKSYVNIVSLGHNFTHFLSVYDCDSVKFNVGAFTKKNGARIEIVYSYHGCLVRLMYHYFPKLDSVGVLEDFVFVPKALTIDRQFKGSILMSIVPDESCHELYIYQSNKSIYQLCVGEEEGDVPAIVSVEAEDDGNTPKPITL